MQSIFWSAATSVGVADRWLERLRGKGELGKLAEAPRSRQRPRTTLVLGAMSLSLYLLTMGGHLDSPDEELMFQVTRSMAERGSMDVGQTGVVEQLTISGAGGRVYVPYSPVASAMSVPFYVVGKALAAPLPPAYSDVVERFAVSMRDPFVSAAAAIIFYALALEVGFDATVTIMLTLAFGVSTLVWVYARHSFSEPVTGFWLLLSVFAAVRTIRSNAARWSAVSAIALGLAVGSKATAGLAAPAVLVYLACAGSGTLGARVRRVAPFVAVLASLAITLGFINAARFGSPFDTGYHVDGLIDLSRPIGIAGLLFSPSKSVFVYAPVGLLGIAGLVRMTRTVPWEAAMFSWIVASQVVFHGLLVIWPGDAGWGPRYLVPIVPFLVLPAGFWLASRQKWAWSFDALFAAGVAVNLGGVLVDQRVDFVWLLRQTNNDFDQLNDLRWDPQLSPIVFHWEEFGRRLVTFSASWSEPVTLVSGTYGKEAVDAIDLGATASSDLFPRWTSGAAVFDLRNHGEPAQLTLEYFDRRPDQIGPALTQIVVDGTPLPEADVTRHVSDVPLPDNTRPTVLQARLDDAVRGHDSASIEIRSRAWQPARDAPPNPDIRTLGIEIWDLHFASNGKELPISEEFYSPMPVTDAQPWSYETEIWFYTPPHLADIWLWYLYLSGLPRWLILLALLPAVALCWSVVQLRRALRTA